MSTNFVWTGVPTGYTPPAGNAVDFTWQITGGTDVTLVGVFTLVRPTFTGGVYLPVEVEAVFSLQRPTLYAEMEYETGTSRPTVGGAITQFEDSLSTSGAVAGRYSDGAQLPSSKFPRYQDADRNHLPLGGRYEDSPRLPIALSQRYEDASSLPLDLRAGYEDTNRIARFYHEGFSVAVPSRKSIQEGFEDGDRTSRNYLRGVFEEGVPLRWGFLTPFGVAYRMPWEFDAEFEEAMRPPPGRSFIPITPPGPEPCYIPNPHLVFSFPQLFSPHLVFQCGDYVEPPPPLVQGLRTYIIMNSLSFKRIVDNEPIAILGASVSTDTGSWCWAFQAELPWTELEKVEPTEDGPVEVELEMNGFVWRFVVENYSENKVFGKTTVSIRGRSLTAYLSQPYSFLRSYVQGSSYLSRQIADEAVTYAGVPTGFSVNWSLVDPLGWDMPAGSFSYNALSPVQIVQALAEGGGGFVNSHPSLKQLLVAAEYPEPFWGWAGMSSSLVTTIPKSLVFGQNLDWKESPAYNGVYVMGENTGVSAWVKRTGTDGAFLAQPVVDKVITHESAARSKGIAILSAGGKQADITLNLPLHPDLGVLTPGRVMEVVTDIGTGPSWRGLSRGVAINAQIKNALVIRQSLRLERHYGGL